MSSLPCFSPLSFSALPLTLTGNNNELAESNQKLVIFTHFTSTHFGLQKPPSIELKDD